jgi:hypothetical protein
VARHQHRQLSRIAPGAFRHRLRQHRSAHRPGVVLALPPGRTPRPASRRRNGTPTRAGPRSGPSRSGGGDDGEPPGDPPPLPDYLVAQVLPILRRAHRRVLEDEQPEGLR